MLYLFNANEFANDPFLLLIPFSIAFAIIVTSVFFNLIGAKLFKKYSIYNNFIQAFLSSIGLVIFINDIFIPTQASALNGEATIIPEPILLSIIELLVGLGVYTGVMINFNNSKMKNILTTTAIFSMILLMFLSASALYFSVINNRSSMIKSSINQQNNQSPNVYFLWLDAMQTDYFHKAITEDNQSDYFNNFTLYKNNITNYLYTLQSYQSFRSGTIFNGKNYKKWGLDDRLRQQFKAHNYNLSSYGMPQYVSELDTYNFKIGDAVKENLVLKHPYFNDFNSLTLVRMAPNFLANEALLLGQVISDEITSYFYPNFKNDVNTIDKGMHPYSGPVTYQHLIDDEDSRKDKGEFVLAQIIMPHGPYVMDKNCQYNPPAKTKNRQEASEEYYKQARCATKLLTSFITKLKKLNRYNDSIIIVMSDHGSGWVHLMKNKNTGNKAVLNRGYAGWNESQLLRRTASLLMIKQPNSNSINKLQYSNKETQLIDLLPTLFSILKWDTEYLFDGRNILLDNHPIRDSILTYYKPTTYPNFNDAQVYHVDYDLTIGRTKLKYIDSFNGYFSIEPPQEKTSLKSSSSNVENNDPTDKVSRRGFEK